MELFKASPFDANSRLFLQKFGSYPYPKSIGGAAYRIVKREEVEVKQVVLPRFTLPKPLLRVGVSRVKQLVLHW